MHKLYRIQQVQNHLSGHEYLPAGTQSQALEDVTQLFVVPQRLHQRLSLAPIPQSSIGMNSAEIVEAIITFCSSLRTAFAVAHSLLQYLRVRNALVTGLRAIMVYPFRSDDSPWIVVEWTEGNTVYMAIF